MVAHNINKESAQGFVITLPAPTRLHYDGFPRFLATLTVPVVTFVVLLVAFNIRFQSMQFAGAVLAVAFLASVAWRFTGRAYVELSAAGIRKRSVSGGETDLAWHDIADADYRPDRGITLTDGLRRQMRISNILPGFELLPFLLVHYAPQLWRSDGTRSFAATGRFSQNVSVILLIFGLFALLTIQWQPIPSIAVASASFLIGAIAHFELRRRPTRLTATPHGLILDYANRAETVPLDNISGVGVERVNYNGATFPKFVLGLKDGRFVDLMVFGNDALTAFGTLASLHLRHIGSHTKVEWVENAR